MSVSLGLPRWFLGFLRNRRQNVFLNDFADAIDVMVRGLKAGLPVSEAMKIIATESGPPVGPEFMEVVEGQRVGISIDQGIERMVERMPLSEVNFLAIVMTIQSKTGGNLSEALANLSRVLRDRKKMKQKIRAVSSGSKVFCCHHWFAAIHHHGRTDHAQPELSQSAVRHQHGQHAAGGQRHMDEHGRSGHAQNDQLRNLNRKRARS